jgi:16S rRNA C1402 (ribose-2'-O) methylase RsmI
LTKVFEEITTASLVELLEIYGRKEVKGEIVLIVAGRQS